ncbi:er membrane protein complex subunit, partial [Fusarium flagelliforme]
MRFTTFDTSALFAALLALPTALASDSLTLYLPAKPNPFTLPASTHATLSSAGGHVSAPLSAANTFVFHNVTPGSYLADGHCPT